MLSATAAAADHVHAAAARIQKKYDTVLPCLFSFILILQ